MRDWVRILEPSRPTLPTQKNILTRDSTSFSVSIMARQCGRFKRQLLSILIAPWLIGGLHLLAARTLIFRWCRQACLERACVGPGARCTWIRSGTSLDRGAEPSLRQSAAGQSRSTRSGVCRRHALRCRQGHPLIAQAMAGALPNRSRVRPRGDAPDEPSCSRKRRSVRDPRRTR